MQMKQQRQGGRKCPPFWYTWSTLVLVTSILWYLRCTSLHSIVAYGCVLSRSVSLTIVIILNAWIHVSSLELLQQFKTDVCTFISRAFTRSWMCIIYPSIYSIYNFETKIHTHYIMCLNGACILWLFRVCCLTSAECHWVMPFDGK